MKKLLGFFIFLGKGPFALIKRHPFLTKRHLGKPGGASGGRTPPNWKLFLTLDSNFKKRIFLEKGTFDEVSNLWMFFLPEVGPEITIQKFTTMKQGKEHLKEHTMSQIW